MDTKSVVLALNSASMSGLSIVSPNLIHCKAGTFKVIYLSIVVVVHTKFLDYLEILASWLVANALKMSQMANK